jgi:hypothetical protein
MITSSALLIKNKEMNISNVDLKDMAKSIADDNRAIVFLVETSDEKSPSSDIYGDEKDVRINIDSICKYFNFIYFFLCY